MEKPPITGVLLAFGAAPYKFEKGESASFYVQLELPTGETKTLWGVGLEKALEDSGVQPGEVLTAQNLGRQLVEVDIKVRDEDGKLTGEVRREVVHRNVWSVLSAPELDWRRDAEQKKQERVSTGAGATSTDKVYAEAGSASSHDTSAKGSARNGSPRDKQDRSLSGGRRSETAEVGGQQHGAVGNSGGPGPDLVSKAFSAPFNVATALGGLFSTSFKEVGHKFTARSIDGYGVLEGQLSDLADSVERKATWLKLHGEVAPGAVQTTEDIKRLLGDFDSLSDRFADLGSKLGYDYAETLEKHSVSMKSALDNLDGKNQVVAELQELIRKLIDKIDRLFSNIKMVR